MQWRVRQSWKKKTMLVILMRTDSCDTVPESHDPEEGMTESHDPGRGHDNNLPRQIYGSLHRNCT